VAYRSHDGETDVAVTARLADEAPAGSVFSSLSEASAFFQGGSLGYSDTRVSSRFQGLELRCRSWRLEPLHVESARSSFYDDVARFPRGSVVLDSAFLMRDVEHEWHGLDDLACDATAPLAVLPARHRQAS
jgi:hypothetical protein